MIRDKHLRSLGFKALVPTATITQLFASIVFPNIPCTCIFCYSISHWFLYSDFLLQSPTLFAVTPASTHTPACAARSLLSGTSQFLTPSASASVKCVLPTCHHPTHSAPAFTWQNLHDRNPFNRLIFTSKLIFISNILLLSLVRQPSISYQPNN